MASEQPDYKKSKNDPYDLNNKVPARDKNPPKRDTNPYDLNRTPSKDTGDRKGG